MHKDIVKKILEDNKITVYLEENGIYPERYSSEKLMYLCPIHGESSPSFVVYPEGYKDQQFQSFHCFGCGEGHNIIHLISKIENVSLKNAFSRLAQGVSIENFDIIGEQINRFKLGLEEYESDISIEKIRKIDIKERDFLYLSINYSIRTHIEGTELDPEEIYFFNKNVFPIIDKTARDGDVKTLEHILYVLPECLLDRVEKYKKNKEDFFKEKWLQI